MNNKGITLIALIVTIIILLIIASISVITLTGDNGLIKRAGSAKRVTEIDQEKEQLREIYYASFKKGKIDSRKFQRNLSSQTDTAVVGGEFPFKITYLATQNEYEIDADGNVKQSKVVYKAPKNPVECETKYNDGKGFIAVIPTGFKVINNGDTPQIDDGLIVEDKSGNQWVWVPVSNINEICTSMYGCFNSVNNLDLCGNTGVTTQIYSQSNIISGIERTLPGLVDSPYYREPDLILGNGTEKDYVNYGTAGFTSLQNMAQSLVDDYMNMAESIKMYKGFYVGRYELTGSITNPTEVAGIPFDGQDWYNSYKACKNINTGSDSVESRMIWGCQWDMIMKWMLNSNDSSVQTYVTDSTGKGNYGPARINTGSNNNYKVKEIYDLAGNCYEWTQEACKPSYRACRGGYYGWTGSEYPASRRHRT